jgi:hypothetical protein
MLHQLIKTGRKYAWELVLVLMVIPTLWPLLNPSFFPLHDYTHVARLAEMSRAIEAGHVPVRWSHNLGYGYGMPQFNFYAPLFYYLAYGFYAIPGIGFLTAIKLTLTGLTLAGAYAMYRTGLLLFSKPVFGLVAATLFTYAPYRAVDFYVRGAFGELLGISAIAVALYAAMAVAIKSNLNRYLLLSLSVAAVFLSHNLIALMAVPVIAGLVVVWLLSQGRYGLRSLITSLGAMTLGGAMAAFYAIPAFFEKRFTRVDELTSGFSDFRHHFLYIRQLWQSEWGFGGSIFGLEDNMSFEIGKILIVLSMAGAGAILWHKRKRFTQLKLMAITLLVMTGSLILMMTFKTTFIWERIGLLAYLQFPWRYLSVIVVLLPPLAAGSLLLLPKNLTRLREVTGVFLAVLVIVTGTWRFRPETYLTQATDLYYEEPTLIQTRMSEVIPDFLPNFGTALPKVPPTTRVEIIPEAAKVQLEIDRTHEFLVRLQPHNGLKARINIFYFPGWKVYIDGQETKVEIDGVTGLMEVELPATNNTSVLSGKFEETALRRLANGISVVGMMVVSGLWINRRRPTHG